jgi:serine protease
MGAICKVRSAIINPPAIMIRSLSIFLTFLSTATSLYAQSPTNYFWHLQDINTPVDILSPERNDPLVIAIVDDGVLTSHQDLEGFWFINTAEVPGNRIDDDGNGYVDDVMGWDVSDEDADASIPAGRPDYNHGTHVAGIVARMAGQLYGERASEYIKLMPVKVLADDAIDTRLRDAYAGVRYAIDAGADVIICAWSMIQISLRESDLLQEAANKGILVVAAAGNFPAQEDRFPAAHDTVIAVASTNREGAKVLNSNYGEFIDISAPGQDIWSASIVGDRNFEAKTGTSFAAAIVGAAASFIKLQHPSFDREEVKICLKSSVDPIPSNNIQFSAKTGAGKLNLSKAIRCELLTAEIPAENLLSAPEGYLNAKGRGRNRTISWAITPDGEFSGLRFRPVFNRETRARGNLEFHTGTSIEGELAGSFSLNEVPEVVYVPGTSAYVSFTSSSRRPFNLMLEYEADTIDFSSLYCEGTVELTSEGSLGDGSVEELYSPNSNCKWLITAPAEKVIHFEFDSIDTEAGIDNIYFFDGARTNEAIMARFSGTNLPAELTTLRNQVLVWFVSDGDNQGQGWRTSYRFVDPPEPIGDSSNI